MAIDKFDLNTKVLSEDRSINENFEKIDKFIKQITGLVFPEVSGSSANIPFLNSDLVVRWQRFFTPPVSAMNYSLHHTVSASALTVYLRHWDGTPPTKDNPVIISTRNKTAAIGMPEYFVIDKELSVVVPSTATLGLTGSSKESYVYVYFVGSPGGELGLSGMDRHDEGELQTTTAMSTSADVDRVLYSPTAQTTKPIKLLGRLAFGLVTAGTWDALATEVSPGSPALNQRVVALYRTVAGQAVPNNTVTRLDVATQEIDTFGAVTTGASWVFTVPKTAIYYVGGLISPTTDAATYAMDLRAVVNGTTYYLDYKNLAWANDVGSLAGGRLFQLNKNDTVYYNVYQNSGAAQTLYTGAGFNYLNIFQVGNV